VAMTVDQHLPYMQAALAVAEQGLAAGELPIGAVVVLNDQIIAAAHTAERRQGRLLVHAELLALEAADQLRPFPGRRREAILYTTCEPCLMCLGAAMSFFVGQVVYAAEAPSDGATGLVNQWTRQQADFPAYQVPQITGGVLRREAIALFQHYVATQPTGPLWAWAKTMAALA